MKKITVLLIVVLLTLALVTPTLAKSAPPVSRQPFSLVGKITSVDPVARTVTVQVLRGNPLVRSYLNKTVVLQVTAATRYVFTDGITQKLITFDDLKVGNPVSAGGSMVVNSWTATRITVGAKLTCLQ
jgi:hypothetical protein